MNAEQFAALAQEALEVALGEGHASFSVKDVELDGSIAFQATLTITPSLVITLPAEILEDTEENQKQGAVIVAQSVGQRLSQGLGSLAFNLASAGTDAYIREEVSEDGSNASSPGGGDEHPVQRDDS